MKFYNINKSRLERYINDYIAFGRRMGYFNNEQAQEFKNKLLNMDIEIDNNAPGDAKVVGNNKLVINEKKVFGKTDEFACLVLFHEFTHLCSNIHHDMRDINGRKLIAKLDDNASSYMDTDYQYKQEKTKKGDLNNPYTYVWDGAALIDEVIAEHVATEMVKMKFNKPVFYKDKQKQYGDFIVNYRTRFNYYGIGESIVDKFSKTLFLKNNCKNLDGLARETFKENFVYELIHQHWESKEAIRGLIEKLGYMGVIGFTEEQLEGRYQDQEGVSSYLIKDSFNRLEEIFREGREERENMPRNIPVPSFME